MLKIEYLKKILGDAKGKKIAVIGDVMLDRFFWGKVSRVSPEAPVPVVDIENETFHLGGAANVANNLKSLGLNPILFGVIGKDSSGEKFIEISNKMGINPSGLYKDDSRPTTVKTRVMGNNQHIVRLDREVRTKISGQAEAAILQSLNDEKDIVGIIFGDYDKGTISESLITEVIVKAKMNGIPVYVDPKFENFFFYKGVTFFKPNKKEASAALSMEIRNEEDILSAGAKLLKLLNAQNVLLTLGSKGMFMFESNGETHSVPTVARFVSDVSGAGDTAIATLAAAIAGGANPGEAAIIANYASGAVCEIPGIVPVTVELIIHAIKNNGT